MDGDTTRDRLGLLVPVCEDWHCLICFLGVSRAIIHLVFCCFIATHHTTGCLEGAVLYELQGPWHTWPLQCLP